MHVMVYSKPGCHLCEDALQIIDRLTTRYSLDVTEVNILDDMAVCGRYRTVFIAGSVTGCRGWQCVAPLCRPPFHPLFRQAQGPLKKHDLVCNAAPLSHRRI